MRLAAVRPPRPGLGIVVALSMVFLLPACARAPEPGVNVRPLVTELVFGVPEIEETVSPPDFAPPSVPIPVVRVPPPPRPERTPPPEPGVDCPAAELGTFAKRVEDSRIPVMPKAGTYEWRVSGVQNVTQGDIGVVNLPSVVTRKVHGVVDLGNGSFRFDVEQPELLFGSRRVTTQSFLVRQEGGVQEAGLFLTRIVTRIPGESTGSSFNPSTPVMFAPLPLEAGSAPIGPTGIVQPQFESRGVDPENQAVLLHRGTLLDRPVVDACGEPVQGWYADAEQEFISPRGDSYVRNYNYMIAGQHGGLIIWEHIEGECARVEETSDEDRQKNELDRQRCDPPGNLRYFARIGQVEPDPL